MSSHFDGRRYFNPGDDSPRDPSLILRWMLTRRPALWPRRVENEAWPPPTDPVPSGAASLTFIGHSTFLIRLTAPDGAPLTVLTDPVFSERCSPVPWAGPRRVRAPGLALDALPRPNVILLSHNHYDHLDLPSLRALHRRFDPVVVTTPGNARTLARAGISGARELDWWEGAAFGALRVTATPARHFARRGLFDLNRSLWAGFMLELNGQRLLFAGDSGAGPHWAAIRDRLGPPGVALLPIGAYEPRWFMKDIHMNPAEAVQAHLDLDARRSIGMHFGTFPLTTEGIDEPVAALARAREAAGLAADRFLTLDVGGSLHL